MKNTLQNKAKFFAQYWGQALYENPKVKNGGHICLSGRNLKNGYLELTSISDITDEDAIEVFYLHYEIFRNAEEKDLVIYSDRKCRKAIFRGGKHIMPHDFTEWNNNTYATDFLRSKGYALPFHDLSVEDLIEYGWVKLIQLEKQDLKQFGN